MFQRIIVDDWVPCLPVLSFCIFAVVFLSVTIRALRLEKSECSRLASLPLDPKSETLNPP
jgi:hypothetical protein